MVLGNFAELELPFITQLTGNQRGGEGHVSELEERPRERPLRRTAESPAGHSRLAGMLRGSDLVLVAVCTEKPILAIIFKV